MSFPLISKLTLYLLVLDALGALYLTRILDLPGQAGLLLLVLASWRTEALRVHIPNYQRLWDVITALFFAYLILDLLLLAESIMAALIHLLVFLLLHKLYNLRSHRDFAETVVLTFLLLIAAATLTVSFGFLLVLSLYLLLGVWVLILFHLQRETDLAYPEKSRELLAASGLFSGRFILSSAALAAAALLLTLAIFVVLPRVGRSFLPFRAQLGTLITGFTDRVELGAYGTIQNDPTIVMRVSFAERPAGPEGLGGLRWRGLAFDRFDGHTWSLADPVRLPVRRLRDDTFLVSPHRIGAPFVAYDVFLEPIGSEVLFGLSRLVSIQGRLPALSVDAGGGLGLPGPPTSRVRYLAVSQLDRPRPQAPGRQGAPADYPPEIRERYLQLPEIAPAVAALARELTVGAAGPYEAARRVEQYLSEQIRYSLDLRMDPDRDPLEEFLFVRKAGNCEYFAASMAILLRAGGIAARVVNGFQQGEWNEVGQYYAVRQRDAHSWVEVYLPETGWATFDPSPRAAFEGQTFPGSGWLGKYFDALRYRWNRYVIDYSIGDQATLAIGLRRQSFAVRRSLGQGWERWSLQASARLRALWRDYGVALAATTALLVAFLGLLRRRGALPSLSAWAVRRGRAEQTVAFYERTLRLLGRRGHARPSTATAREFARRFADRAELAEPVLELTTLYERVRFGGEPLAPAEERRVADLLARLTSALR
jgi:transglutaminase-like putative cysteine protease